MLPASSRFAMRLMNVGCHAVISKYLKVLYTNRISSLVKIPSFRNTYQQAASISFTKVTSIRILLVCQQVSKFYDQPP